MSTQEEKNVNEELNAASEETVENTEAEVNAAEETPQEPLSETEQLKLQLAEAQEKMAVKTSASPPLYAILSI